MNASGLSASPTLWLGVTVAAYVCSLWLQGRAGRSPLVNPVLISIAIVAILIVISATDYPDYFASVRPLHLALGPAVVALAVPLYRQLSSIRAALPAVLISVVIGGVTACATAFFLARGLGAPDALALSVAPRAVTTPVAIEIAALTGGLPALTAVAVIAGGIFGAVLGDRVLDLVRVRDQRARGLAIGCASHAIGTARQLEHSKVAGAYGGLALSLNAIATAIYLPLVLRWLVPL
jgi:predicted murein hydrolase (TIGR00659 family)